MQDGAARATTAGVSGASGMTSATDASTEALRDWQAVRANADIQFAPVAPAAPPEQPAWLREIGEAIARALRAIFEPLGHALGLSWPVLEKVLLGLSALAAAWVLWRLAGPMLAAWRKRAAAPAPEWTPDAAAALALLEDADRLAAAGHYDEATHLLLKRSVGQIAAARPDWLTPASTAREIAVLPALPPAAREAFALIAARVERSLFALVPLGPDDWQAARAAYARFALTEAALTAADGAA